MYLPEVIEFIKERTGADEVVTRGAVLRRSAAPAEHASQPQAALVHIDYGPEGAEMTAPRVYAEHFPDGPGYRRALAASFWRVFSPPPQDWPLALCDFRSLRDDEGLPNQLYFVDRIPDDPFAEVDESKMITSGSEFVYSPDHEWWYFPDMTRDEVLFFVFHDSDHSHAWRVLHSAFRDPTVEDVGAAAQHRGPDVRVLPLIVRDGRRSARPRPTWMAPRPPSTRPEIIPRAGGPGT